ncbi:MAG: hypothetical protein MRERV_51c016, partial [Mycoplasmataceae bacterium RV_VA103A]
MCLIIRERERESQTSHETDKTATNSSSITDNNPETNESTPLSDNSANQQNLPSGPRGLFKLDLQFFNDSADKKEIKRLKDEVKDLRREKEEVEEERSLAAKVGQALLEQNTCLESRITILEKQLEEITETYQKQIDNLIAKPLPEAVSENYNASQHEYEGIGTPVLTPTTSSFLINSPHHSPVRESFRIGLNLDGLTAFLRKKEEEKKWKHSLNVTLEKRGNDYRDSNKKLTAEIKRLKIEHADELSALKKAAENEKIKKNDEKEKQLEAEEEKEAAEIENEEKKRENLLRKITELKGKKSDLAKQLENANEQLITQTDTLNRQEWEIKNLQTENGSLRERNSELNDWCLKQDEQISSLTGSVSRLQAENEELKKGSISGRSSARPSMPTRPNSRAFSLYDSDSNFKNTDDHFCRLCGHELGSFDKELEKAINKPPTTPNESHSEKEEKS